MIKPKPRLSAAFLVLAALLALTAGCGNSGKPSPAANGAAEAAGSVDPNAEHPVVTIEMDSGKTIKLELYPEVAPNTVSNFISLAKKGFYNGTIFHRVIPGFMIQGGDPDGTGGGGPGYSIAGEFAANGHKNELKHTPGVLSMARAQNPDSAGSQFFIMVADAPHLDGQYAAFGKVTEGLDVIDEIVSLPRDAQDKPNQPPAMKSVTVETNGMMFKEPEKVE